MNCISLIGRLTRDPELKESGNGTPVATLRLAIPRRRNGEDAGAVFVTVVCFDRVASAAHEHLYQGRRVAVVGRLEHREWTDGQGIRHSLHEIVADAVDFLDSRPRAALDETSG